MNQSEILAITYNLLKAWEVGEVGFASHYRSRKTGEIF